MRHLAALADSASDAQDDRVVRATGRFYTSRLIADHLLDAVWRDAAPRFEARASVRVCDPFAGDGRLVCWLIERAIRAGRRDLRWTVALWDLHEPGLAAARESLEALARSEGVEIDVDVFVGDAFMRALTYNGSFDVVVTNPPWENLKPDRRELEALSEAARKTFIDGLREYDILLGFGYPLSQPERKFAGWGTNLARVGTEAALRLAERGGTIGVVTPASLLADDSSAALRRWMLTHHTLLDAAFVPAEARQFGRADVSTAVIVLRATPADEVAPKVTVYDSSMDAEVAAHVLHPPEFLRRTRFVVPISFGIGGMEVLLQVAHLQTWAALEATFLWAGRELDETGVESWLGDEGAGLFVKGRMIERLGLAENPSRRVCKPGWRIPPSVSFERVAWRDVSRPSQKRRVIATLIPAGWIAGNSLGVAHFRSGDSTQLRALLAVMSSCIFEFQLRCFLATGHVSLTALRKVHIPDLLNPHTATMLASAATMTLGGVPGAEARMEALVARSYGIDRHALDGVVSAFPKLTPDEREAILAAFDATEPAGVAE